MNSEKLIQNTISYTVNITNNAVDSLRKADDLKTVIRVYEGECVGIAGAIGLCDEQSLLEQAKDNLNQGIPYPCNLTPGASREETVVNNALPSWEILQKSKSLVSRLAESYPDYIFSGKIATEEYSAEYTNDADTRYFYKSDDVLVSLSIKGKNSANIFDLGYGDLQTRYSEDEIVGDVGVLLNVYDLKLPFPEEEVPVLIGEDCLTYMMGHLTAEKYMSGASMFNGKLGQKIFDERVKIVLDRKTDNRRNIPFFDCEGSVAEGDEFALVEGGELKNLLTYKRSAAKYGLPLSASASANYDGVPAAGFDGAKIRPTCDSLKELVNGRAIYVAVTSGGDMTPSGDLGLPVMLAYVYENGLLLGTLPEFSLSGNIFDVLGKDFIGVAKNDAFSFMDETLIVARMKINK